jgi:hypothetical protein
MPIAMLASVRTLNRMEFAGETLRAALEALAAAAPAWLSGLIGPEWTDRYGARIDSYACNVGLPVDVDYSQDPGHDTPLSLGGIRQAPPGHA